MRLATGDPHHEVDGFIVENIDQAVEAVARLGSLDRHDCRRTFERRFGLVPIFETNG